MSELGTTNRGVGAIISVNTQVGVVVLDKTSIGLANVDNTNDASKIISTDTQTALNAKENIVTGAAVTDYYRGDKSFQTLDKASVGLGQVDNIADTAKVVSSLQAAADAATLTSANTYSDTGITNLVNGAPSALNTLSEIAAAINNDATFSTTTATSLGNRLRVDTSAQGLTAGQKTNAKTNVDLENADNTTDANKPISTATQTALNAKENTLTATTTADYFRGDKTFQNLTKTAVGLANVDNTTDAAKAVSTATQIALDLKQNTLTPGTNITIVSNVIASSGGGITNEQSIINAIIFG